jgi:hypothetical protein
MISSSLKLGRRIAATRDCAELAAEANLPDVAARYRVEGSRLEEYQALRRRQWMLSDRAWYPGQFLGFGTSFIPD